MIVKEDKALTNKPLVTVQVYAYNKEEYIRECLDSVLNQKTTFEYEVLLSENPGTDKTRDICIEYQKKYPDKLILVLREENMGFFYNYFEAERMSRGKYIARCDADDYWCDELKLQKLQSKTMKLLARRGILNYSKGFYDYWYSFMCFNSS